MLFRGDDGLDELTTTGPSTLLDVADGTVSEMHLDPAELGLDRARLDQLQGGDADTSAAIVREILAGGGGPKREVVLLNAAAALTVSSVSATMLAGLELAAQAIDDGVAAATLERWVAVSQNG
jgi:anthranilate phosphoribosyltransferase